MVRCVISVVSCLALAAFLPAPASAQGVPADSGATTRPSAWRFLPAIETRFTLDDNVFLLGPTRKDNLDVISASEAASGRYTDMESASDVVSAVEAALAIRGRGAAGRRLEIVPEVRYERFASNSRRSAARFGVTIEQTLPKDGRLRLGERFTPGYFAKNYLHDAVDLDGSLTISADERRYRAGTYSENETWLDWRFRLARRKKSRPVGAALQLGAGYYQRAYEAPFEGRDLAGPKFSVLLDLDLGARAAFELEYALDALGADPSSEVLLLDEPDFGSDFNGNANSTDLNVRSVQTVDRSRAEHAVQATLRVETSPKSDLKFFAGLRARRYGSEQPYDVSYRDRRDLRLGFGTSLRVRIRPDADFTVGGEFAKQTTNRAGDPGSTGDVDDYSRGIGFVALSYRR